MKRNVGLIIALIIFILISLGLSGFIVYDKYLKEEVSNETKEEQVKNEENKTSLTLNDELVQTLYSYIKSENNFDQSLIDLVLDKKSEVLIKDIKPEILNFYGYRQLKISVFATDICRNYTNALKYTSNHLHICTDSMNSKFEDDETINNTKVIKETDLKKSVENIFGIGSYKMVEMFEVGFVEGYIYDNVSRKYVNGHVLAGGGTDPEYTKKLIDIKQEDNILTLIETISFKHSEYTVGADDLNENIKYNFKETDGKYYLYSIDIEE